MCSFSSNEDLVVIINPVLPWFDMITSLTFSLLRPIPASVGPMSDIEEMVLNTSLRLMKNSSLWTATDTVIHLALFRVRLMLTDKGGSASLNYDERFVGTVALSENLPCNLFLAHAAFTEYTHIRFC